MVATSSVSVTPTGSSDPTVSNPDGLSPNGKIPQFWFEFLKPILKLQIPDLTILGY